MPSFVQYDDARLEIELMDYGVAMDLSQVIEVRFAHKRADGETILGTGQIVDNVIIYDYLGSEMLVPGPIETAFSLIDADGTKVSVQPFKVQIHPDLCEFAVDPATLDGGRLSTLLNEVAIATNDANVALTSAENLRHQGEYNFNTDYKVGNFVSFEGSSYIAKVPTKNNLPTDVAYWATVAVKGLDGQGTVNSVNGLTPDVNGDIDLGALGTVLSVNGVTPGLNGDVALSVVNTVNGVSPDVNGELTLSVVSSVDGFSPDINGNIALGAIRSINDITPDVNGDVALSIVSSVDGFSADVNGDLALNAVRSVNGEVPDVNGDVALDAFASIEVLTSDPVSPKVGQIWMISGGGV